MCIRDSTGTAPRHRLRGMGAQLLYRSSPKPLPAIGERITASMYIDRLPIIFCCITAEYFGNRQKNYQYLEREKIKMEKFHPANIKFMICHHYSKHPPLHIPHPKGDGTETQRRNPFAPHPQLDKAVQPLWSGTKEMYGCHPSEYAEKMQKSTWVLFRFNKIVAV